MRRLAYIAALSFAISTLVGGCKTKYLPVVQRDSIYISGKTRDTLIVNTIKWDSVFVRDSVSTYIDTAGVAHKDRFNLVVRYSLAARDKYAARDSLVYQTRYKERPVLVDKPLGAWDKLLLTVGKVTIALLGVAILLVVYKLAKPKL